MTEPIEIDVGSRQYAVIFSADGKYLLSGGDGVQVWRVEDSRQVARLLAGTVQCLAVSQDGRWIAGGISCGGVYIWDARTYQQVHKFQEFDDIRGVDFSPNSTRLVSASENKIAVISDVATGQQVQILHHDHYVKAAKYSSQGDRIATATYRGSVRVWDSSYGSLLLDIPIEAIPYHNTGLLWLDNQLLIVSHGGIIQVDAATGSTVLEWPSHGTDGWSCITLPKHGGFVAYSMKSTVAFWNTSTRAPLGLVHHPEGINSIAISPDDRSISIGGVNGKVRIENLVRVTASAHVRDEQLEDVTRHFISSPHYDRTDYQFQFREEGPIGDLGGSLLLSVSTLVPPSPLPYIAPPISPPIGLSISASTFREVDFSIDDDLIQLWRQNKLTEVEALLTEALTTSLEPPQHVLASRALVRARLQNWVMAITDAEMAIEIQPSVIAYIAKGIAHIGDSEKQKGYRACDIAFEHLHPSHITFLLLIKARTAIVVFIAGDCVDAILRMDDLITTVPSSPECRVVQAFMHLLVGNLHMESGDYEGAIKSFECARAGLRPLPSQSLSLVSLISGWRFDDLNIMAPRRLCDALYLAGRTTDAIKYFHQLTDASVLGGEHREWALDFKQRSSIEVEHLGDTAAAAGQYDMAISHYSTILSLDPPSPQDIFLKRSKAYMVAGSYHQALDDANQVIALDPSSPWGYGMKHAALHKAGNYDNAVIALEMMLSTLEQSPDPDVQRLSHQYIRPSSTRAMIRKLALKINRRLPRELVNTTNGRLYDRTARMSAFESSAIYRELVSSMTTHINKARIKREIRQYFRYVMFSHKWDEHEPSFQKVADISVYNLDQSPTHDKLKTFCTIVRDAGIIWAWSDTCCINKSDHFILQEALVAMFKWYEGSTLTIVYLRGVHSLSQLGTLVRSIWNTRAWTLQEYIAAKVVHFYTEDWTPYLGLQLSNHKESREVISEMEEATGVSAEELMALRPGLSHIREKLRLASTRETTFPEDAAYSLLGIFLASGIPAIYGEGSSALGRLLANVLTRSGDASVLAWSGESGRFNSCLPANISVFNGPVTAYLPRRTTDVEMDAAITASHAVPFDLDSALRLYDRLQELPTPRFAESRMTLPCIPFRLPRVSLHRMVESLRIYRTNTEAFGMVEIKTKYDLSRSGTLFLVYPWLGSLFEHVHGSALEDIPPETPDLDDDNEIADEAISEGAIEDEIIDDADSDDSLPPHELQSPPLPSTVELTPRDIEARARRLVARLRQPFGALLFRLTAGDQRVVTYKRVAADSPINVQFLESFPLARILERVRTVDVL